MSLITESSLSAILHKTMGPFVPPTICQPTIVFPVERMSSKPSPLSGVPVATSQAIRSR